MSFTVDATAVRFGTGAIRLPVNFDNPSTASADVAGDIVASTVVSQTRSPEKTVADFFALEVGGFRKVQERYSQMFEEWHVPVEERATLLGPLTRSLESFHRKTFCDKGSVARSYTNAANLLREIGFSERQADVMLLGAFQYLSPSSYLPSELDGIHRTLTLFQLDVDFGKYRGVFRRYTADELADLLAATVSTSKSHHVEKALVSSPGGLMIEGKPLSGSLQARIVAEIIPALYAKGLSPKAEEAALKELPNAIKGAAELLKLRNLDLAELSVVNSFEFEYIPYVLRALISFAGKDDVAAVFHNFPAVVSAMISMGDRLHQFAPRVLGEQSAEAVAETQKLHPELMAELSIFGFYKGLIDGVHSADGSISTDTFRSLNLYLSNVGLVNGEGSLYAPESKFRRGSKTVGRLYGWTMAKFKGPEEQAYAIALLIRMTQLDFTSREIVRLMKEFAALDPSIRNQEMVRVLTGKLDENSVSLTTSKFTDT